jgi:hypothetical protein
MALASVDGGDQQPLTAAMLENMAATALAGGHLVVVEGILDAKRYGAMLERLQEARPGRTRSYYFSIPLEETLRRHATRDLADVVTPDEMRAWYRQDDMLGFVVEQVVHPGATAEEIVGRIIEDLPLNSP